MAQHSELGELSPSEVELVKQSRKPAIPPAEQQRIEKRGRFEALCRKNPGRWDAADVQFMRDEAMPSLLAGRLPFGVNE